MQHIFVLNGPNLGMLGARQPEVYGHATLADITDIVQANAQPHQCIDTRQTDSETELIGWLHEAFRAGADVILNPAAFTHYSYALRDAVAMLQGTSRLVEVHITNPHARESFRHTSVISGVAEGVIAGFGIMSYVLALRALTANDSVER